MPEIWPMVLTVSIKIITQWKKFARTYFIAFNATNNRQCRVNSGKELNIVRMYPTVRTLADLLYMESFSKLNAIWLQIV